MYSLILKTEDLKFDVNKRNIIYDSLYSENTIEYIRYFIDNLKNEDVKIFDFRVDKEFLDFKGKDSIRISLRLNRKSLISKIKDNLKKHPNEFLLLINPPLEILKEFNLGKRKFLIYVNQLPADDLLIDLKTPLLFIGRNFSNEEQSSFYNIKYYLYKNKIFSISEKIFIYLFIFLIVVLFLISFNQEMNNIPLIFFEYLKESFDKFLGIIK
jgi:hypothetical protein